MYWKQWIIDLRGCMVRRAKAISSRHLVWINSATHSFMLRRVSFSVSALTLCMEAFTTSSSLIAARRSSCSCSAFFFSACLASHSALRLASAASCSARRLSSSAAALGSAGISGSWSASSPSVSCVSMESVSSCSSVPLATSCKSPSTSAVDADTGSTGVGVDAPSDGGTGSSSKVSSSSKGFPTGNPSVVDFCPSCIFSDISEKYPIVISFLLLSKRHGAG